MLRPNPPGRPPELTVEIIDRIISNVSKVIIPNQVAGLSRIPRQRLSDWLIKGKDDIESGKDSIYAQLRDRFDNEQSKVCEEIMETLRLCPRNYGALTWILEKCFKEDFEVKSEYVKKLEDYVFNVIQPMIGKGEIPNGGKEGEGRGEKIETEETQS